MKRNIIKSLGIGSLCLFLLGCSENEILVNVDETKQPEAVLEESTDETWQKSEIPESDSGSEQMEVLENSENEPELAVHICGAVNQPGVYIMKGMPRIYEGIQKAGGFTQDAAEDYLNLALLLEDGMKVTVPTRTEVLQWQTGSQEEAVRQTDMEDKWLQKSASEAAISEEGKINLNTADVKELMTLPGIGESRAASIIEYREQQGLFKTKEDIMNVTGIKEAAYEKIKELITVS